MFYRGPKSSLSRVNAYSAKVRAYTGTGTAPDYVSPVCQFKLSEMYRKFQQVADDQHSYQARVFVSLGGAAVNSITYGSYLAFAAEVYSASRRFLGDTLRTEVAILLAKWEARGLDSPILRAIRNDVFGVTAPLG